MTIQEFNTLPDIEQIIQLRNALEASVSLQAHYAKLLNTWDGGERRPFANADEWLLRLYEIGELAKPRFEGDAR